MGQVGWFKVPWKVVIIVAKGGQWCLCKLWVSRDEPLV